MKKNKNLIVSLVSAFLGTFLVVGGTYAIFLKESETTIATSSGTVEMKTQISDLQTYSGIWNESLESYDVEPTETNGIFATLGTAEIDEKNQTISLKNIVPMDKVTFKITVTNLSTVDIKYRSKIYLVANDGLFESLEFKINDVIYDGTEKTTDWQIIPYSSETPFSDVLDVSIYLPEALDVSYENKSCTIGLTYEAVQGNVSPVE